MRAVIVAVALCSLGTDASAGWLYTYRTGSGKEIVANYEFDDAERQRRDAELTEVRYAPDVEVRQLPRRGEFRWAVGPYAGGGIGGVTGGSGADFSSTSTFNSPVTVTEPVVHQPGTVTPLTNSPLTITPVVISPMTNQTMTISPVTVTPVTITPVQSTSPSLNQPVTIQPVRTR